MRCLIGTLALTAAVAGSAPLSARAWLASPDWTVVCNRDARHTLVVCSKPTVRRRNGTYLTAIIRAHGTAKILYRRRWWSPHYTMMRYGWDYSIKTKENGVWHKVITLLTY